MRRCVVNDVLSAGVRAEFSGRHRLRRRHFVSAACQCHVRTGSCKAMQPVTTTALSVDDVLHSMRRAHPSPSPCLYQTQIRGTGEHLGIAAAWQMTFRPDGAFHCQVDAPPVSTQFGWNGVVGVASWEREAGIVRPLVYDDHELVQGAGGFQQSNKISSSASSRQQETHSYTAASQSSIKSEDLSDLATQGSSQDELPLSPDLHLLSSSTSGCKPGTHVEPARESCINLYLSLQGGQCVMSVLVNTSSWKVMETVYQPKGILRDRWVYSDWFCWQDQLWHPRSIHHWSRGQAVQVLYTDVAERLSMSGTAPFDMFGFKSRPSGTHFLASFDACLATLSTDSGHVLVQPIVNRQHVGWMLLDSGVSGMSLDIEAVQKLKLKAHGTIRVQTIGGFVDTCLLQVKRFELGTLVMHGCLFMKLPLTMAKAIKPPPEVHVAGVVGYDVLTRALLVIPAATCVARESSNRYERSPVRLAGPPLRPLPEESFLKWHPLIMVCQLPHVHVQVNTKDGAEHSLLMMVDTGFVGADMILSASSTARLGLAETSWEGVRGLENLVGIGHTPVDMMRCVLPKIEICGHEVCQVDVLCSASSTGLQTPSAYADGFVGMGLLSRFDLWLDVMHERIALEMAT